MEGNREVSEEQEFGNFEEKSDISCRGVSAAGPHHVLTSAAILGGVEVSASTSAEAPTISSTFDSKTETAQGGDGQDDVAVAEKIVKQTPGASWDIL